MSVPGPLELEGYRRCAAITRRHGHLHAVAR